MIVDAAVFVHAGEHPAHPAHRLVVAVIGGRAQRNTLRRFHAVDRPEDGREPVLRHNVRQDRPRLRIDIDLSAVLGSLIPDDAVLGKGTHIIFAVESSPVQDIGERSLAADEIVCKFLFTQKLGQFRQLRIRPADTHAHKHRFGSFVGDIERVVPIGVMNARKAVHAEIIRPLEPFDRAAQMPVNVVRSLVQIGQVLLQIVKIARLLDIIAYGKDQPHGRIGINIFFQIRVPGQHRMPVGILMRGAFVYDLLCSLYVIIEHRHAQLRIVAHGFLAERTEAHLFFRPEVHDPVQTGFGADGVQRIAAQIFLRMRNLLRRAQNHLFGRSQKLLLPVRQAEDIMENFFLPRRKRDLILQNAAPRAHSRQRIAAVLALFENARSRNRAERADKFFIISVIGVHGQFGKDKAVAALVRTVRVQKPVIDRIHLREKFGCRSGHGAVIDGLRISVQIKRGRREYAELARAGRAVFQAHLPDLVGIGGRDRIGHRHRDPLAHGGNLRKFLAVHTFVSFHGCKRGEAGHIPIPLRLIVADIDKVRPRRIEGDLHGILV